MDIGVGYAGGRSYGVCSSVGGYAVPCTEFTGWVDGGFLGGCAVAGEDAVGASGGGFDWGGLCGVVVSASAGVGVGVGDGVAVGVGLGGCFVAGAYVDAGGASVGGGFVLGGVGGGGGGGVVAEARSRSPAGMTTRKARAKALTQRARR